MLCLLGQIFSKIRGPTAGQVAKSFMKAFLEGKDLNKFYIIKPKLPINGVRVLKSLNPIDSYYKAFRTLCGELNVVDNSVALLFKLPYGTFTSMQYS